MLGVDGMSMDMLREKIRKTKNPSMVELALAVEQLPTQFSKDGAGYGSFCQQLLEGLKGNVGAVRLSFTAFSMLGHDGLYQLSQTLIKARDLGYYVLLDAPEILSPAMASIAASNLLGQQSLYPCDGLVVSGYLGSDVIKPFLPYCKKEGKDLFVVVRTANKSAPELQDLLSGTRLVHEAAADHVNRHAGNAGKSGYAQVGIVAAASAAESLRSLRAKYPKLFILVDGYDYPNANAKNCASAFDKFGHGAVVCGGEQITCAWKKAETDGADFIAQAQAAAERMKKNLTRYTTVL